MPRTPVTGIVNVTHYTAFTDDVFADDALINIYADTRLALTGDDLFLDDTIAMAGQLRVRAPLEVSGLHIDDTVAMVNVDTVTQTGSVAFGAPAESDDDTVTIRNIAGAVWDMAGDVSMTLIGGSANLVNLGLLEKTGGSGLGIVEANVRSLGTVEVDSGALEFGGLNSRFFGDITGAGAVSFISGGVFLDNMTASVASFSADDVVVRGAVTLSGVASVNLATLQLGATLTYTESATAQSILPSLAGRGTFINQGIANLTQINLQGNVELDNAGVVNAAGINIGVVGGGLPGESSITAMLGADNMILIKNLAGAIWINSSSYGATYGVFSPVATAATATFENDGTFVDSGAATEFLMNFVNNGVVEVEPTFNSSLEFQGDVGGTGTIILGKDAILTVDSAVSSGQTLDFVHDPIALTPSVLNVNDIQDFAATIAGFGQGGGDSDTLVFNTASAFKYLKYAPGSGGGSLIFTNKALGGETAIHVAGDYVASGFQAAVSSADGTTTITYTAPG